MDKRVLPGDEPDLQVEPLGAKIWLEHVKPRLDEGMTPALIAAQIGVEEAYIRDLIETWTTPSTITEGPQLFADVKDFLRRHFYLEREWQYDLAALWVFQAKVAKLLPSVFYLFISGRFGSGKTNLLNLLQLLTGGLIFENTSVAAIARTMEHGRAVLIDEYDVARNKEYDETRDALVRQGYKANAAPYKRWNATGNKLEEIPIFGPKALTLRGLLDPALQSRGYEIPTSKCEGEGGYDFVLANMWPMLGDVPARLDEWARIANAAFNPETLEGIAKSDAFKEKVRAVVHELGGNRDSELAVTALLVSHVAGIDLLRELREANALHWTMSGEADADDLAELSAVVLELATVTNEKILDEAPEVRILQPDIKARFNERRKARGERPVSDRRFATLRRELGVRTDWLRRPGDVLRWDLPSPWLTSLTRLTATPYGEPVSQGSHVSQGEGGQVYNEDTGPQHPDPRKQAALDSLRPEASAGASM